MYNHITRMVTILTLISMSLFAYDTSAQPPRLLVEEGRCSDPDPEDMIPDEVVVSREQEESDGFVRIRPSLFYQIPSEAHTCNITLTFEAATSELRPQLLELAYFVRIEETAPPAFCEFQPGPVLTEVRSGLDETHTMISRVHFEGNTDQQVLHRRILPCVKSTFGEQFRLRRRCLLVQCY